MTAAQICSCLALLPGLCAAQPNADPFPRPASKKGLQVQMVDDAISLGIHHAGINASLGALFFMGEHPGALKRTFEGRDCFINQNYARSLDAQIKPLTDAGVVVNMILLAYPTKDAAKDALLLHPKAKADGKYNIAAFNTATQDGLWLYRALIDFLAERYSGAHTEYGRAWGWIIGNEVNSQWLW